MKKYWRILKIALAGKYGYLKWVNRWRRGQLFRDLQELTPYYFESFTHKYGDQNFILAAETLGSESPFKNFGMVIPQGPVEFPKMVEDPNGAPIYRGCNAKVCACTGRCKEIIGYSQDPEDLLLYRELIEEYNKPRKPFDYHIKPRSEDSPTKIYTWGIDKQSNL